MQSMSGFVRAIYLVAGLALVVGGCGKPGSREAAKIVEQTVHSCGDYAHAMAAASCAQFSGHPMTDYDAAVMNVMPAVLDQSRWGAQCAPYKQEAYALAHDVSATAVRRRVADSKKDDVLDQCDAFITKDAAAYPDLARQMAHGSQ